MSKTTSNSKELKIESENGINIGNINTKNGKMDKKEIERQLEAMKNLTESIGKFDHVTLKSNGGNISFGNAVFE